MNDPTPLTDAELENLANQRHAYALTNAKVLATVTFLQGELKRTREALTWQPIETAPKDGARFIADLGKYGVHIMRWYSWGDGAMWKTDYQFVPINMIERTFKGWRTLPEPTYDAAPTATPPTGT
jgi:hypothetical protein